MRTSSPASLSSLPSSSSSFFSLSSFSSDETEAGKGRLVPPIICGEKEEEEMATNLRTEFHERQRKCLSEFIIIGLSSSNKARLATSSDSPPKPTLLTLTTVVALGPAEKPPSVGNNSYHEMRKPFVV